MSQDSMKMQMTDHHFHSSQDLLLKTLSITVMIQELVKKAKKVDGGLTAKVTARPRQNMYVQVKLRYK